MVMSNDHEKYSHRRKTTVILVMKLKLLSYASIPFTITRLQLDIQIVMLCICFIHLWKIEGEINFSSSVLETHNT